MSGSSKYYSSGLLYVPKQYLNNLFGVPPNSGEVGYFINMLHFPGENYIRNY